MYIDHNGDTIFAPATTPGTGAISIIRISGPEAIQAAAAIVSPANTVGNNRTGIETCNIQGISAREPRQSGNQTMTDTGKGCAQGLSASPNCEADAEDRGRSVDDDAGNSLNPQIMSSKGYRIHFGRITGTDNKILDEVLVSVFRSPHSYTGEDSVEISCHASSYIVSEISSLLVRLGLRPAEPGEFTRRAFLNGKMDLAQAEAVADVIAAQSAAAHRVAISQMKGGFSSELKSMRSNLLEIVSLLELELDFSDEDVEFVDRSRLDSLVYGVLSHIRRLMDSFRLGNAIKNGIPVAIVGATNVGKSTLLNALLGEDRAIVSDIHGTTRDTIEETLNIDGVLFRFIDTAGLRETSEKVEKIGIERSYRKLHDARIVLGIVDATRPDDEIRNGISEILSHVDTLSQDVFIIINKCDAVVNAGQESNLETKDAAADKSIQSPVTHDGAGHASDEGEPDNVADCSQGGNSRISCNESGLSYRDNSRKSGSNISYYKNVININKIVSYIDKEKITVIPISAGKGTGLDVLKSALASSQKDILGNSDTVLVTNIRHFDALSSAATALERVKAGLSSGIPTDLVAQDLREALYHLGSILGEISTDEVLGNIFRNFCIGK